MATPEFRPTHVVPPDGMPAWEEPDVSRPTQPLDPLLPVELVDRRADWGRIVCANGWSAWVDGRLLVAVPRDPPEAGKPMARTADPRPLMARVEEAAGQYRRAAQELAEERIDGETFQRRTQGLRVGMVVDGEAVWLYDAEHERWVYCDGRQLSTYAAGAGPGRPSAATPEPAAAPTPAPAPAPEPTRVVDPEEVADSGPHETAPGPDENSQNGQNGENTGGAPPAPEPTRIVDPTEMNGYDPAERGTQESSAPTPVRDGPRPGDR
ncbi:hypothetical protein [Streptomyces longhuiensis]|uniref:hypothetical protein n=1 Tax=Streptomyces TaxID=1883 RepID=UPI001D0A9C10|nr:hypothetical protein [Streptomyces longhuiensis]UDM02232.1 hypothetical protein LGI35_30170 [Streptomyces longhuiensis]